MERGKPAPGSGEKTIGEKKRTKDEQERTRMVDEVQCK